MRDLVQFVINEAPPQPRMAEVAELTGIFVRHWQTLWFRHGPDESAMGEYATHLHGFLGRLAQIAGGMSLRNGADLTAAMSGILRRAVRAPTSRGEPGEEGARTPGA